MAERTVAVRLVANIASYRQAMGQAAQATRELGSQISSVAASTDSKLRPTLDRAGYMGLAFGGAVAAGAGMAVKAAIDWESAWAGVTKTVDGTAEQMSGLEDELRGLARELPASHGEIAAVAEAAGQLGIQRESIVSFTETMIALGETTNLSADQAATAMARMANIMQTPQSQIDRMGATLVALGNAGASTEAEIVDMALRIAGAGKQIGLSEADVLAFANALSSVGVEADAGGSAISRVFVEIASAVSSGGDSLDAFADVAGLSAGQFATAFREDAAGAVASFIEGLGQMQSSGQDVFGTLDTLGLSEIRVRDALLRAAGAGDLFRESLDLGNQAWKDNTALVEEARKRYETSASKLAVLRNNVTDLAIDFGTALTPALLGVTDKVGGLLDGFRGLPGPMQQVVGIGVGLAGAAAAMGGGFLLLAPKIKAAKDLIEGLATSAPRLASALNLAKGAAGPLAVAIGIGTAALSYYGEQKRKAKQRTDEFVAALEQERGGVAGATRELIAKKIVEEGLDKAAQRHGISVDTLVRAIEGERDAINEVRAAGDSWDAAKLIGKTSELASAHQNAKDKLDRTAKAEKELGIQHKDTASTTGDVTDATEKFDDALDALSKTLDQVLGIHVDAEEAQIRWQESIDALTGSVKEHGRQWDIDTEAGRRNRSAILDVIDASRRRIESLAKEGASNAVLNAELAAQKDHLRKVLEQSGLTRAEIDRYIGLLDKIPPAVATTLTANTDQAMAKLRELVNVIGSVGNQEIVIRAGAPGDAAVKMRAGGGPIRPGEWLVGEHGPERMRLEADGTGFVYPSSSHATRASVTPASALLAAAMPAASPSTAPPAVSPAPRITSLFRDLIVQNPKPEPAGSTVSRELRRAEMLLGLA